MATLGGRWPGDHPPDYDPIALATDAENLHINQRIQQSDWGPRPSASPFSQPTPTFTGNPPFPSVSHRNTVLYSSPLIPSQSTSLSQALESEMDPSQISRHNFKDMSSTGDYKDSGTASSSRRYMRCTLNQIPCTADLLSKSGMQLALMVQPLALPMSSEEPIDVIDFGEDGPVRCSRCNGYINPFMKFIDHGRHFICNLCGFTNETPDKYYCNIGPDGRRWDAVERRELCRGTVEFIAPYSYMLRESMTPVFFFLIDVSMNAVQTGAAAAA